MSLRHATFSFAVLALGLAVAGIPACAPGSDEPGSEGTSQNDAGLTGSIPVGTKLIATASVNLRSGPSTAHGSIDVIPDGDSVTVVTATPQNGYYQVRYGTEVGWSSGKYFKLAPGSSSSTSTSTSTSSSSSSTSTSTSTSSSSSTSSSGTTTTTLIATTDVNLRSGPGTTYSILEVVPSGAVVTLLSATEQNGFYNIEYQGVSGWSSAAYFEAGSSGSSSSSSSSTSSGATTWSCTGSYGTVPMADGEYYATEFGCYIDSSGNAQQDPGDNCIPSCLSQAQSSGLCSGMSGPTCEDHVAWYAADGARFGCLARLKVTNQANGKSVVVVALDYGPSCSVEAKVQHAAIDLSYPADAYLFGGATGISDKALVHVDVVDPSTPLGPQ